MGDRTETILLIIAVLLFIVLMFVPDAKANGIHLSDVATYVNNNLVAMEYIPGGLVVYVQEQHGVEAFLIYKKIDLTCDALHIRPISPESIERSRDE